MTEEQARALEVRINQQVENGADPEEVMAQHLDWEWDTVQAVGDLTPTVILLQYRPDR